MQDHLQSEPARFPLVNESPERNVRLMVALDQSYILCLGVCQINDAPVHFARG